MAMKWAGVLLFGAVLFLGGWSWGKSGRLVITNTVIDTVPPNDLVEKIRDMQIQNDGLVAALEGVRELKPDTVWVTDTTFVREPPDTVVGSFTLSSGRIEVSSLLKSEGGWTPRLSVYTTGNCDDRLGIVAGSLLCDPARLGHLGVGPGVLAEFDASPQLTVGLSWRPSYTSPWFVNLHTTGSRHLLWVQRSIRLF